MKQKIIKIIIILMLILSFLNIEVFVAEESESIEVPGYVDIGDLLFMDFKEHQHILLREPGMINDHVAIYIGDNEFVHAKHFSKVETKDYKYFLDNYIFHQFAYVNTTNNTLKEEAAFWAKEQVGKKYQNIKAISEKGENDKWYNSELIWYAYKTQGIDIDSDSDENHAVVTNKEILDHNKTMIHITKKLPEGLKKGDIIFMDIPDNNVWNIDGSSNDHAGLYMGKNFRDGTYMIHASSGGVSYVPYHIISLICVNFTFFRVNVNESIRNDAVQWAVDHLGCKYQFFFPTKIYNGMWEFGLKCANTSDKDVKTSNRFYCMELIWASYYNQGIELDSNGWEEVYPEAPGQLGIFVKIWELLEGLLFDPFAYVTGNDIIYSENTTKLI